MATASIETASTQKPPSRGREWQPHIWEGCSFRAWMGLLIRNRFAVHWSLLYVAIIVTFVSLFNSGMGLLQHAIFGRRVRRTVIREAPIFIIGHWRTGTTLLHELMILDERHNYPTTYECLAPNHFLVTEPWLPWCLPFLMPSRRPMDNMPAGWERPQEDEFALCMLGVPSPYLTIAFPNRPPAFSNYLDLEDLTPRQRDRWKRSFRRFIQEVTFKDPRRLVLKSPPHSCRIKVLVEMFPDARFVHIVRDPYIVFPSTVNLWMTLFRKHGLQRPTYVGLDEYVYETFTRLYDRLEDGKKLVPPNRYCELRYEDLVRDPVTALRSVYEALELDGVETLKPRLEEFVHGMSDYETNRYAQTPEQISDITRRWGRVLDHLGYSRRVQNT